jgi:hypothetical protein
VSTAACRSRRHDRADCIAPDDAGLPLCEPVEEPDHCRFAHLAKVRIRTRFTLPKEADNPASGNGRHFPFGNVRHSGARNMRQKLLRRVSAAPPRSGSGFWRSGKNGNGTVDWPRCRLDRRKTMVLVHRRLRRKSFSGGPLVERVCRGRLRTCPVPVRSTSHQR